jgi:hypothetical protein
MVVLPERIHIPDPFACVSLPVPTVTNNKNFGAIIVSITPKANWRNTIHEFHPRHVIGGFGLLVFSLGVSEGFDWGLMLLSASFMLISHALSRSEAEQERV